MTDYRQSRGTVVGGFPPSYEAGAVAPLSFNPDGRLRVETGAGSTSNPLNVSDPANAAFQGVIAITPGTPTIARRSIGFVCTASGSITLTLADGSAITLPIPASPSFQSLPFAVTNVALGSGTSGTFWNLK